MLRYTSHFKKRFKISPRERWLRIRESNENEKSHNQNEQAASSSSPETNAGSNGSHEAERQNVEDARKENGLLDEAEIITRHDIKSHTAKPKRESAAKKQTAGLLEKAKPAADKRKKVVSSNAGHKVSRRSGRRNSVK